MLLIQILLVIAVAALTLYFLSNRRKARAKAGVKIGFVVFLVIAIFAVLFPDATTWVAQLVGVQRGTDLMLYGLIVAFVFVTISSYLRFREQELRFARLARAVALSNAQAPGPENTAQPEETARPENTEANGGNTPRS
ncbi:DUF2304 domain-containing protein [Corynebacterium propinquum]|jgi:hypothetical protein cresD4_06739|uniref:DUF2304 domain-containing protein n=1 Tax=Corynebacterium propinquum TaxID=43769 RepID=UPI000380741A|nr:DUF2304 domain-containing protein [Corynebacterium propinquum]MCT1818058.1 DUF2304 domain-containing protein [Corynebacterium propinquum]MDK4235787.1 DUF2304 domain-containing protein [Corynebacterium propinquum]MDK4252145.1 DUF2304 domain-containing protein [Corynebacterium propinquum]MDK4292686.1 DUF2304 domain-containing protein [Corynebacterium propinquum]QQU86117.1 DUF2304 domain-containing protein [Corynebacterium propinquum]